MPLLIVPLGLMIAVTYLLDPQGGGGVAFATATVVATLGAPLSIFVYRPAVRWPLWSLAWCGPLFLLGIGMRSLTPDGAVWDHVRAWADLPTMAGYAAIAVFVYGLISPQGRKDTAAALDAAAVGLSCALVVWAALVNPAFPGHSANGLVRFADVACPMADALILFLVTRVYMSRPDRTRALAWVTGGLILMFIGDAGYGARAAGLLGALDDRWLSVWFLLAYLGIAIGVLQPDVTELATPPADRETTRLDVSRGRLGVVLVAMFVPLCVLGAWPQVSTGATLIGAGLAVAQTGTTFVRLTYTVRALSRQERESYQRARTDDVTGLPNRVALIEHLTRATDRGQSPGLILVAMTGFSAINDSWGPTIGDRVVTRIADSLRGCVGAGEFLARVESDVFALAVTGVDAAQATSRARALLAGLPAHHELPGLGSLPVTAIAGTAAGAGAAADLLRNASLALHTAHDAGDGAVQGYGATLHQQVVRRLTVVSALRDALARRELTVAYQPLYSARSRCLVGFEALLRWHSPELGNVSPAEFVPLAEESGLIVDLGAWALDQAAAMISSLPEDQNSAPLHVAVNLAPRQLLDPALADLVADALARHRISPARLWLEITESALMSSPEQAAGVLERLKGLGVTLALDDFGTGHSSLAHLSTFPVDVLKIDRAFTSRLAEGGKEAVITEASIELAHRMNMLVVAEGVETPTQLAALNRLGCDILQGFLLGEPDTDTMTALTVPPVALAA